MNFVFAPWHVEYTSCLSQTVTDNTFGSKAYGGKVTTNMLDTSCIKTWPKHATTYELKERFPIVVQNHVRSRLAPTQLFHREITNDACRSQIHEHQPLNEIKTCWAPGLFNFFCTKILGNQKLVIDWKLQIFLSKIWDWGLPTRASITKTAAR